ncbi:MAG: DNA adenine methylase [Planctomycetia bacterium]|nr:DNA adenine methylase [Planctomycetia bacterium]
MASVPQLSPFRYPGGKTWLVPHIRAWMRSLPNRPALFVEPFVGGGIISLTVAAERLAEHSLLVELDANVAAVWQTILGGRAKWLADRIMSFEVTVESVEEEMSKAPRDLRKRAFRTILKNRVYHGGIMAPGSSLIRHGENNKGIKSRWYPTTLKKRILGIADIRDRLTFIHGDGLDVLGEHGNNPDAVFFLDPPYTAAGKMAGKRLYEHNELDHERLFEMTASVKGDFLMTYDNASGVVELANRHGFDTEVISMKNTHHAKMTELLIGRDLSWVRVPTEKKPIQRLLFDEEEREGD